MKKETSQGRKEFDLNATVHAFSEMWRRLSWWEKHMIKTGQMSCPHISCYKEINEEDDTSKETEKIKTT